MTLSDETYADVLKLASTGENSRHQAPRVPIWDVKAGLKLPVADSPRLTELPAFLAANPHCEVFSGQQPPLKRLAADEDDIAPLKKQKLAKLVWEIMKPDLEDAADEEEEDDDEEDEAVLRALREENPTAWREWSCR